MKFSTTSTHQRNKNRWAVRSVQPAVTGERQVVRGDFNCPRWSSTGSDVELQQLVTQPTHHGGNTLDLINFLEQAACQFVRHVHVQSLLFSDHSLVGSRLGVPSSRPWTVSHTYREIQRMDLQSFRYAVLTSRLYDPDVLESYSEDAFTELFEADIPRLLDICAPFRTWTQRSGKHDRGFHSNKARNAKCTCRRLKEIFPVGKGTIRQTDVCTGVIDYTWSYYQLTSRFTDGEGQQVSVRLQEHIYGTLHGSFYSKPVSSMSDDVMTSVHQCRVFMRQNFELKHAITDFIKTISCDPVQMLRPFGGSS